MTANQKFVECILTCD